MGKEIENSLPYLVLKTARPRQWIKNFSVYAALIFSGFFFFTPKDGTPYFYTVSVAFVIFCLLASSVYIVNDVLDAEADSKHPFKRKRPIASGKLSKRTALFFAGLFFGLAIFLSLPYATFFKFFVGAYFVLQMFYSKYFKHIPILDISSIATGFLLRVYAGSVIVNLHMSVWFLLTVISASLFLAVGKRQSERTLLQKADVGSLGATRKILTRYSTRLLDEYTSMFATATWLSYALFTFESEFYRPNSQFEGIYSSLPNALHSKKLLMLSLPFVIFGVMRYLHLIYEKNEGESPERILLSDWPLLATVFLFGLTVMSIIYVFA